MFDKIYKAYLDLNANTKQFVLMMVSDDNVYLSVDQQDWLYIGHMSFSGGQHVLDGLRHFELLYADKFSKWNA